MKDFDLLVIGEINPDLILTGDDIDPAYGQVEKLVEAAVLTIGSSSVILACGAARLGLRTAFIGLVGDDVCGRFMLDAMRGRGVDTSACVVDPAVKTGISVILARRDGDRAVLTFMGSISALKPDHVDTAFFSRARHLHVGGYFLLDQLRSMLPALFREARRLGLSTSLDTNWDPRGEWELGGLLAHCDLFLPNETEARQISRQTNLQSAVDTLSKTVPILAVKLGAKGGLARQGETILQLPPPPVDIVDTIGAGDSFDAGFLYGFLHHWPLERTLRFALACGSLSTRAPGGTDAQPTLEQAKQWLKE
ncbi:MAG: sugar kinase [Chloroflexi bacterium]|nr:sugar kinase [Chloroflexota bacterium]MCI0578087.1 sugar kinase [Chloroflexota bacterium]MCI0646075.1 sugar kinase [Chloroflexota bacterium]MCI0730987.1 sugar kinase [Chloroflexota bacterium]